MANVKEEIVIKKAEPTVKEQPKKATKATKIDCEKLIDTAFSYLIPGLEILEFGNGQKCMFCGDKTSYNNRHVCVKCWYEHNKEIAKALKKVAKGKFEEVM